jgi:hypothetical protein
VNTFVWVDAWQLQCCGDDFRVDSDVTWTVVPQDGPDEWVELLLGAAWAERVRYHEEHHSDGDPEQGITGTVRSIREVTCRRTPERQGSGEVLVPVPGSGVLTEVAVADSWGPEPPEELRGQVTFDGWIVELELEA